MCVNVNVVTGKTKCTPVHSQLNSPVINYAGKNYILQWSKRVQGEGAYMGSAKLGHKYHIQNVISVNNAFIDL